MLDAKSKQKIITKFAIHAGDTGSTPVQIAILSEEIIRLTEHLKEHKKDNSSRRGLMKKISERRKLLRYYASEDQKGYEELAKKLKIKIRDFNEKKLGDQGEDMPIPEEKDADHILE